MKGSTLLLVITILLSTALGAIAQAVLSYYFPGTYSQVLFWGIVAFAGLVAGLEHPEDVYYILVGVTCLALGFYGFGVLWPAISGKF